MIAQLHLKNQNVKVNDWFSRALILLKQHEGVTQEQVANKLGLSRQTIVNFKSGRSKPTLDTIQKFCQLYNVRQPDYKELEYDDKALQLAEPEIQYHPPPKQTINSIKYYATAYHKGKSQSMGTLNEEQVSLIFEIPNFSDCDFAFNISGHDMEPEYQAGDIALVKEIKNFDLVNLGEVHLVVTSEFSALKMLSKASTPDKWLLKSTNPRYEDWEIKKDLVLELYVVRGTLKRQAM
jgi:transcriptional regulator with XRE-family HTH domain